MNYFYFFIFGVIIGSFLNVIIYRLPLNLDIVKGRSMCTSCGTQIQNYDLIPIISFFILKGKCRACKIKFSIRYMLIELFTGIVFVCIAVLNGPNYLSMLMAILSAILITISMIDFDTLTIPDSLILSILILSIPFYILEPNFLDKFIGFFIVSLPMFLVTLRINNGFGGGDIKLMAVLGLILGWKNTLLTIFLGSIFGVIYAILDRKIKRGSMIPFGPYICLGGFISMLFGENIINWYLSFI